MKVYVASNGQASKIGISWEPENRMRTLRHKGTPADLCRVFAPDRADLVEKLAHELLMEKRAHGEWFNVTPDEACAVVERAIEQVAEGWRPNRYAPQEAYRANKIKAGRVETLVRVEGKDADDLARLAERLDVSKPEVFRIALRQLADKKGNR